VFARQEARLPPACLLLKGVQCRARAYVVKNIDMLSDRRIGAMVGVHVRARAATL